jgi:hypothetical protein
VLHIANSFHCRPQNAFSHARYAVRDVNGRYTQRNGNEYERVLNEALKLGRGGGGENV